MHKNALPTLRALSLSFSALLAGTVLAQARQRSPEPSQEVQESQEERAEQSGERERELRRVLELANGQHLRGLARWRDGAWEHRSEGSGGWVRLDPTQVAEVKLERELLAQMREREKALGRSPGARVELAGWLASVGLFSEALDRLGRALEESPHERAALDLLAERPWVRLPQAEGTPEEARAELLAFGARSPRVLRELAILELARRSDETELRALLERELAAKTSTRRSFAAHALGRIGAESATRRLVAHAVLDVSDEVRREAALALAASEEPGLVVPVARALNSADPRVRTQAAEALGQMGYAAAVEPLVTRLASVAAQRVGGARVPHSSIFTGRQFAFVQDFDVEVATFQAVADPQLNVLIEGSAMDAAVLSSQRYAFAYESQAIRRSLSELTGANPGSGSRDWQRWWEANRARYGAQE